MPITLITGLPGSGKTLRALWQVERERRTPPGSVEAPRAVYHNGIPGLAIDWVQMDPPKPTGKVEDKDLVLTPGHGWYEVPDGAAVVIDECQHVFRPRGVGSRVPTHVQMLETHRHRGIDIYLITQRPGLVDSNVRALVGRHLHVKRSFGMNRAVVYEWNECNPDPSQGRQDAQTELWAYPEDVFKLYKSAELHTVQRRLPRAVGILLACVVALPVVGWLAWHFTAKATHQVAAKPADSAAPSLLQGVARSVRSEAQTLSADAYVASYSPRVPGLAYTAPAYDEVTKPKVAPLPVACVSSHKRCACFSQQGTALDTGESLCRAIVSRGFFESVAREEAGRSPERPASSRVAEFDRAMALRAIPEVAPVAAPPSAAGPGSAGRDPQEFDLVGNPIKTKFGRIIQNPSGPGGAGSDGAP